MFLPEDARCEQVRSGVEKPIEAHHAVGGRVSSDSPHVQRVFMSSPDPVGSTAHGRRVNLLQQSSFPSRGVWTGLPAILSARCQATLLVGRPSELSPRETLVI